MSKRPKQTNYSATTSLSWMMTSPAPAAATMVRFLERKREIRRRIQELQDKAVEPQDLW